MLSWYSKLSLTFLKTAGLGRGGPKGGTSSLAVTDTCWWEINNSHTVMMFISSGLRFQAETVKQSLSDVPITTRMLWWVIHHGDWCLSGYLCAHNLFSENKLAFFSFKMKNTDTITSACRFPWFVPCMLCALCMDSQPAPAHTHAGSWRQSCLEQMVWPPPGRLQPRYHFLCAFSSGAEGGKGDFILQLCSSKDTLRWHMTPLMKSRC